MLCFSSEQLAVRQRLQCKPFKWFMEEVAADMLRHFPYHDPPDLASGEVTRISRTGTGSYSVVHAKCSALLQVRNSVTNLCLDTRGSSQSNRLQATACGSMQMKQIATQVSCALLQCIYC